MSKPRRKSIESVLGVGGIVYYAKVIITIELRNTKWSRKSDESNAHCVKVI